MFSPVGLGWILWSLMENFKTIAAIHLEKWIYALWFFMFLMDEKDCFFSLCLCCHWRPILIIGKIFGSHWVAILFFNEFPGLACNDIVQTLSINERNYVKPFFPHCALNYVTCSFTLSHRVKAIRRLPHAPSCFTGNGRHHSLTLFQIFQPISSPRYSHLSALIADVLSTLLS